LASKYLNSPFYDLWQESLKRGLTPGKEKASREWFRNQAKTIKIGKDPIQFIKDNDRGFGRKAMYPGFMYFFEYDAKFKDDPQALPYWDQFPLCFCLEDQGDRTLDLNLHYLRPPVRAALMDKLYSLATNKTYNDNQRLALSYGVLKAAAQFKAFKPCVKVHLKDHRRSRIYKIPAEFWDVALFLPLQRFHNKSATYVWSDSMKKMK
jgi:hypothetical protein